MPGRCAVPLCHNQIGGFLFPNDKELRHKWILAVKRISKDKKPWFPSKYDVVCREHFVSDDFRPQKPFGKGRHLLHKNVVPSIFPFKPSQSECGKARAARAKKRESQVPDREECQIFLPEDSIPIGANEVTSMEMEVSAVNEEEGERSNTRDVATECNILTSTACYRIKRFAEDPKAFLYLTGFNSYEHFVLLFNILGPSCFELSYQSKELDPQNELFLTLIKLRQAKDDMALAIDFGIGRSVVSRIVKTWINFMYFELSELNFWPSRIIVDEYFPSGFQTMFSNTRVILDATEVPIQKPKNCNSQRVTFSTYKNCNTLKTMVGISPRGVVSYLSDSYGGSASDRQILERSPLLKEDLLSPGDAIMADRGIMVQDLFAHKNVHVNTPTTMKGRNQHDPKTVVRDRRIASKRIHVERVIGYAKTFKILRKPLGIEKVLIGGRIVKVCFLLTNFKECIVGRRA